jgi:hypothetical protein
MNRAWTQTDVTAPGDTNETDVFETAPIKETPDERTPSRLSARELRSLFERA